MREDQRSSIGIALDSGGAKGGAHLGVLQVLEDNDIYLDIITGSSAGAFAGAVYAAKKLGDLLDIIKDMNLRESLGYYLDPVFPTSGLLGGKRVRTFLEDLFGDLKIEDLAIRFVAVATDLLTGETVVIDKGPVVDAIMASISMPGIFKPVIHMDRLLTDGGVSDPLPVDVLKDYSPKLSIACNLHPSLPSRFNKKQRERILKTEKSVLKQDIDFASVISERLIKFMDSQQILEGIRPKVVSIMRKINSTGEKIKEAEFVNAIQEQIRSRKDKLKAMLDFTKEENKDMLNIFEIMAISTNIQQYQKNKLMLSIIKPDVVISPEVDYIGTLDFTSTMHALEIGRKEALKAIPSIKRLIEEKGI
ncbi:MAG TPA: hypothetical protein ENG28_02235 [Deltaproteobacteria bacterium]|nr:hypothetical protein [Deltaproteobacteria bacterium]